MGGARGICCGLGADQCGLTRESGVPVPPGPVEEGLRERVQHPGTAIHTLLTGAHLTPVHKFLTPVIPRPPSYAQPHSTLHLHTFRRPYLECVGALEKLAFVLLKVLAPVRVVSWVGTAYPSVELGENSAP